MYAKPAICPNRNPASPVPQTLHRKAGSALFYEQAFRPFKAFGPDAALLNALTYRSVNMR